MENVSERRTEARSHMSTNHAGPRTLYREAAQVPRTPVPPPYHQPRRSPPPLLRDVHPDGLFPRSCPPLGSLRSSPRARLSGSGEGGSAPNTARAPRTRRQTRLVNISGDLVIKA